MMDATQYSAKSAYKMQFLALNSSPMPSLFWKPWTPPKCNIFAWLVLQNRACTVDRLTRRGCQNCGLCKICSQHKESAAHLLFKCRLWIQVWSNLKNLLGIDDIEPITWHGFHEVKRWWIEVIHKRGQSRKALASLAMLVSWEIWKERNATVFHNKSITVSMLVAKMKEEAEMRRLADAKAPSNVMPRE
jgi:hypothetical protein